MVSDTGIDHLGFPIIYTINLDPSISTGGIVDVVSFFFVGSRAGLGGEDCQTLRPVFRVRAGAGRKPEAQLHTLKGQRIVGGRSVRGRAVRRGLGCGSFRSGGCSVEAGCAAQATSPRVRMTARSIAMIFFTLVPSFLMLKWRHPVFAVPPLS